MARRASLSNVEVPQEGHAGLWADRFLNVPPGASKSDRQPKHKALVAETAAIKPPPSYGQVYTRWQAMLHGLGAETAVVKAPYRLAVGHGRESVIETGLTIHHTYGVPYIPGSSLKGAAAAFARGQLDSALWGKDSDAYRALFGSTATAGYVTFLDALPVAGEWQLLPDVITVHHPKYYQSTGDPPADWDDPTPIPFLSAKGQFLLAVVPQAGAAAWARTALELLAMALKEMGVGGKTSSGYGRLE